MIMNLCKIVMFVILFLPTGTFGQSVAVSEDTVAVRQVRVDSLSRVQEMLDLQVQGLASEIDSLRRAQKGQPLAGELEVALRQSVQIALNLEAVYIEQNEANRALVDAFVALLGVYDQAIGALIANLGEDTTPESIGRLKLLQQRRKALASIVESCKGVTDLPMVVVRAEDGPDAIRQKAMLMADVASQIEQRLQQVDARLQTLVNEQRLHKQAKGLVAEISLFDERTPVGRSLRLEAEPLTVGIVPPSGEDAAETGLVSGIVPGPGFAGDVAREQATVTGTEPIDLLLKAGLELQVGSGGLADDMSFATGLASEILQKQRQRALLAKQAKQAGERAKKLQAFLDQMIGGGQ